MDCSKWENQTSVTEFLLLGMLKFQSHRVVSGGLLFILYLLSLFGNVCIVAATYLDTQLHSPMYFFLRNLSFVDLCLSSVTLPKGLATLMFNNYHIYFQDCFTQMYMFLWFVTTECALLAAMSYDRYVAICKPLHYTSVMSKKLCTLLVVACWAVPTFRATLHVILTYHQCFCGSNAVRSFFCDITPVLDLSCSDNSSIINLVILSEGGFVFGSLFVFIFATYTLIIASILKLQSNKTRKKAFLTCSSHLTVIILFYGSGVSVYFVARSDTTKENNILSSMMYTVLSPTLNPFIYSLRNNEIQAALKKGLMRKPFHGL